MKKPSASHGLWLSCLLAACSDGATPATDSAVTTDRPSTQDSTAADTGSPPTDSGAFPDLPSLDTTSTADVNRTDTLTVADLGVVCNPMDLGSAVGMAVGRGMASGVGSAFEGSCGGGGGREMVLAWTAPAAGSYTFTTQGSGFDTVLYLRDGVCSGAEIACNDDHTEGLDELWSSLTVTLRAGQRITLFIDAFEDKEGPWVLNIAVAGS